ncbi:MAG TPA: hypothetical protein VF815_40375 [Myxococcaceae bacterium]|jgi:hypothetical protein
MKMIIAVAALGFGTLVGCGGVEDAQLSETGELQSVTQALCESPPTGNCEPGTAAAVTPGLTCAHYTWSYTWTCMEKFPTTNKCLLWKCSSGGAWASKGVSGHCDTFRTSPYCI